MPQTRHLDVETYNGEVVAIWFGCLHLPFHVYKANQSRAEDVKRMYEDIDRQIAEGKYDPMTLLTKRTGCQPDSPAPPNYQKYEPPSDEITSREW